jgi:hypothetical protein
MTDKIRKSGLQAQGIKFPPIGQGVKPAENWNKVRWFLAAKNLPDFRN